VYGTGYRLAVIVEISAWDRPRLAVIAEISVWDRLQAYCDS